MKTQRPALECGDVICTIQEAANGQFQGKVIVAERLLKGREERVYVCPESDATRRRALHRAMEYVDALFLLAGL